MSSCSDNKFKQKLANLMQLPCDTLFPPTNWTSSKFNLKERHCHKVSSGIKKDHCSESGWIWREQTSQVEANHRMQFEHNTRLIFHLLINATHIPIITIIIMDGWRSNYPPLTDDCTEPPDPVQSGHGWWRLVSVSNFPTTESVHRQSELLKLIPAIQVHQHHHHRHNLPLS